MNRTVTGKFVFFQKKDLITTHTELGYLLQGTVIWKIGRGTHHTWDED